MDNSAQTQNQKTKRDWHIFGSSVFFVLGFSFVFSILGVLLQTALANVSYSTQEWLGRIGGVIIILFGLFILGLFRPAFLDREHKFRVKTKFRSHYVTSFVFGAAFAVGWTPCVTAALGAILALATSQAGGAFVLLMSYTLGLGIPFLLVGLFVNQAQALIQKSAPWLRYVEYVFGVILIIIGVLIFTGDLNRIANFEPLVNLVGSFGLGTTAGEGISSLSVINISVAFFAGLVSFLSPCILPLIPGFLSYLATVSTKKENDNENK